MILMLLYALKCAKSPHRFTHTIINQEGLIIPYVTSFIHLRVVFLWTVRKVFYLLKFFGECFWRGKKKIWEKCRELAVGRDNESKEHEIVYILDIPGSLIIHHYREVPASFCIMCCVPLLQTHGSTRWPRVPEAMLTHSLARGSNRSTASWCHLGISALGQLTVSTSTFARYALEVWRKCCCQKAGLELVKSSTRQQRDSTNTHL